MQTGKRASSLEELSNLIRAYISALVEKEQEKETLWERERERERKREREERAQGREHTLWLKPEPDLTVYLSVAAATNEFAGYKFDHIEFAKVSPWNHYRIYYLISCTLFVYVRASHFMATFWSIHIYVHIADSTSESSEYMVR